MVSIIMPVYNAEKYLAKAIESVLHQDYTDYELILVDDGSTDQSGIISDKYASNDNRIRVFHKENEGVSSARRLGYDESKGDWITFMDNDDIIAPYFLSNLWENNKEADIIIGNGINVDSDDLDRLVCEEGEFVKGNKYCFTGYQMAELMIHPNNKEYSVIPLLWGRIISRRVMERAVLLIDEYKDVIPLNYFEDFFIVPRMFISTDKVMIRNEIMYYHRVCADSPSHTLVMKPYNYEQIEAGSINLEYYKSNNLTKLYKGWLPHYYFIILKIWYSCHKYENDTEMVKWCSEKIDYYYSKYYAHLSHNEYVGLFYKFVIKSFKFNKRIWSRVIGDLYFNGLYKYREKIIK